MNRRAAAGSLLVLPLFGVISMSAAADPVSTIERVKPSIVAIGTYERTRNPSFIFSGTGFAIADGSIVATNAHVVPANLDTEKRENIVAVLPGPNITQAQVRIARVIASDRVNDLALLAIEGPRLPPLSLGESTRVKEGQTLLFTGFPIGSVLGLFPATHRALVAALTPIAIPWTDSTMLDAKSIRRLSGDGPLVMQLDAIAYPGSSGSPVFDPDTGTVMGVINSTLVKGSREMALSQPSGIAYALPVQWLTDLLKRQK